MRRFALYALMLLLVSVGAAQEKKEDSRPAPARNDFAWARLPYRLDYTVKEVEDGKVVNSRAYSLIMQSSEERGRTFGEVRAGSRVPVNVGEKGVQYLDVGVGINSRLYQLESGNLALDTNVEISTLAGGEETLRSSVGPVIRQIRSNTFSEISAGKTTQIAQMDDPISKHRFQIEVTATKLR